MSDMNIGILLAGGSGTRFNAPKPKQEIMLCGKEMISYSIDAFRAAKQVDDFVVVLNEEEYMSGRIAKEYRVKTVQGGKTLNESKWCGLEYVKANFPNCNRVVIHAVACPLVTSQIIDEIIAKQSTYDYIQCAYKIRDALSSDIYKNVNRDDFYLVQSPEVFDFLMLYTAFDPESKNCNTASHLPENAKGAKFWDFSPNLKVTYPEDKFIVEQLLSMRQS